jgi:hypothetical protein
MYWSYNFTSLNKNYNVYIVEKETNTITFSVYTCIKNMRLLEKETNTITFS